MSEFVRCRLVRGGEVKEEFEYLRAQAGVSMVLAFCINLCEKDRE